MNRFRSRKKAYDGGEKPNSSTGSEVPSVPSIQPKTFKRSKKPPPEAKQPQIDITTVLPSSDDFRISLLMPNLSARFSMLREQDDPTSKIGKANDDSVLFPRRASRLNLFNRYDLGDIAEVDSIRGSVRPPLSPPRSGSHASFDGYGTDDGGVMSRSRPGEGNTLFGGRQKIYKIPMGGSRSSKNSDGNEDGEPVLNKGMGGRALYGDDVASSAFRGLPEQENQQHEEAPPWIQSVRSSKENERSTSPPIADYNQDRDTTSSTTSIPTQSRTSTAATSVASQRSMNGGNGNFTSSPHPMPVSTQPSIDRQQTRSRRLYGQGLDQHMYDQQSHAMQRLESLQRQRATGSKSLLRDSSQSRSATNLHERYQNSSSYATNGARSSSPPPSSSPTRLGEFDLGLNEERSPAINSQPDQEYGRSPPLSPPMSPVPDPTLVAALEPNDVGKATASGAFNKPRKQYDEQQYLQRQIQLQQGRETPPPNQPSSAPVHSIDEQTNGRLRDNSEASIQPRPHLPKLISKNQSGDQNLGQPSRAHGPSPQDQAIPIANDGNVKAFDVRNAEASFLVDRSPSDLSSQAESELDHDISANGPSLRFEDSTHWVFKNPRSGQNHDVDRPIYYEKNETYLRSPLDKFAPDNMSETTVTRLSETVTSPTANPENFEIDSPTLGPATGLNGLNGLVKTHLRNDSGQSSIYPEQSPDLLSKFPMDTNSSDYAISREPEIRQSETFFRKSTWENDDQPEQQYKNAGLGIASDGHPIPSPLAVRARHVLEQSTALQNYHSSKAKQTLGNDKAQRILGREAPRGSEEPNAPPWQEQLKAHHARGGSTETEKERQSFANELAERKRMVQDNLKSYVENESRSPSPMPGSRTHENSPSKPGTSFGILKTKSSRGSLAKKHDNPSKAMKMLGINAMPNEIPRSAQEDYRGEDAEQPAYDMHDRRVPIQARLNAQDSRQYQNNMHVQRHLERTDDRYQEHLPQRRSPTLSKSSREDRSNSDCSERRPNSRNGRALSRGNQGDSINGHHPDAPQFRKFSNSPKPGVDLLDISTSNQRTAERSQSAMSSRMRSTSRTNVPGYFEQRGNPAVQTISPQLSNRSPSTPYSAHSATTQHEVFPTIPVMTTPVMMVHQQHSPQATRVASRRRRSINKQDISDPRFISSTSSVSTVNLPPGASLTNGIAALHPGPPPPVPPLNPRRKRTQTLLQVLGRSDKPEISSPLLLTPRQETHEERSTFSADEGEPRPKPRTRLRKTSSEGGNLNVKARQQAMHAPSPAVPNFPQNISATLSPAVANFPPYLHPHPTTENLPATAAMF